MGSSRRKKLRLCVRMCWRVRGAQAAKRRRLISSDTDGNRQAIYSQELGGGIRGKRKRKEACLSAQPGPSVLGLGLRPQP